MFRGGHFAGGYFGGGHFGNASRVTGGGVGGQGAVGTRKRKPRRGRPAGAAPVFERPEVLPPRPSRVTWLYGPDLRSSADPATYDPAAYQARLDAQETARRAGRRRRFALIARLVASQVL